MNLTKVVIKSNLAEVNLPLVGARATDEYICKNIDGLGPPEVDLHLRETLYSGLLNRGRRPQGREIIIRVALTPNYQTGKTAGDLRQELYGLLSAGDQRNPDVVQVRLHHNEEENVWASTRGYVKRIEIVPFVKDPEVQITITCLQPYLVGASVYPDLSVMNASNVAKLAPRLTNPATGPTGFRMELVFSLAGGNARYGFSLQPVDQTTTVPVSFNIVNVPFINGDKLVIDTRPGVRQVTRIRDGVSANLLSALHPKSVWPLLRGGGNDFIIPPLANFSFTSVFFYPNYWGI